MTPRDDLDLPRLRRWANAHRDDYLPLACPFCGARRVKLSWTDIADSDCMTCEMVVLAVGSHAGGPRRQDARALRAVDDPPHPPQVFSAAEIDDYWTHAMALERRRGQRPHNFTTRSEVEREAQR